MLPKEEWQTYIDTWTSEHDDIIKRIFHNKVRKVSYDIITNIIDLI